MKYISTRNKKTKLSSAEVIVKGISSEGGLFVPESFPKLEEADFQSFAEMDYCRRAAKILNLLMDDFTYEELLDCTTKAYSRFEEQSDPCPLVEIDDNLYVMELWHGPTLAFKDMALTLLPHLLTLSRSKLGLKNKSLILVATSGDTGKAALEGFKDVEGVDIIVFYPSEGVSDMQKLQMTTQEGNNVCVYGINGNFDDAQNAVKKIFTDNECIKEIGRKGYALSSANSINWGRLAPQIAYYISAYTDLLSEGKIRFGDKINITVPSGNFGNILAAYYAKKMGLPVEKLICASNINNVLTDFLNTGKYDINRDFHKTISPSMDILISSNLERLLFDLYSNDDIKVSEYMKDLKEKGCYEIDKETLNHIKNLFIAGFASEEETMQSICNYFEEYGYLIDTHTAVACSVESEYELNDSENLPTLIISTASPYKFPTDVLKAVSNTYEEDGFKAVKKLHSLSALEIPESLSMLNNKEKRFNKIIDKNKAYDAVLDYLESKK